MQESSSFLRKAAEMTSRRDSLGLESRLIVKASAAGFIRCDSEALRMSEEAEVLEFEDGAPIIPSLEVDDPSESNLELANRLIERLSPENRGALREMISKKGSLGGGLVTLMVVFWWLAVDSVTDNLDVGLSKFFGFNFSEVALIVIGLALISSILKDFSRELGLLAPSFISGGMVIFSALYVFEPLINGLWPNDFDLNEGLFRALRLTILWVGVTIGAKLLVDSALLMWLKQFCDANGIDIQSNNQEPPQEMTEDTDVLTEFL
tara:strand:+ start:1791 stop:2582 length:792 start_codon:yes stop_codon:yes gene_type:complete